MSAIASLLSSEPSSATPHRPARDRSTINRENAQHSTGPKTEEGKARVRLNATKHGLYSKSVLLPGEDAAAFALQGEILALKWNPQTEDDRKLVRAVHEAEWRIARIVSVESALYIAVTEQSREAAENAYEGDEEVISAMARALGYQSNAREFDQLHRQEARLQRLVDRAERELKQRAANRPVFPNPPEPQQPTRIPIEPENCSDSRSSFGEPGFVPSLSMPARYPPNMPSFSGPQKKEHRRQWLRKHGYGSLANPK